MAFLPSDPVSAHSLWLQLRSSKRKHRSRPRWRSDWNSPWVPLLLVSVLLLFFLIMPSNDVVERVEQTGQKDTSSTVPCARCLDNTEDLPMQTNQNRETTHPLTDGNLALAGESLGFIQKSEAKAHLSLVKNPITDPQDRSFFPTENYYDCDCYDHWPVHVMVPRPLHPVSSRSILGPLVPPSDHPL